MVISCPSCKKVFGKPLVMLDFSSGKPKLVNVCPYCNAVLGRADEKSLETTHVVGLDKETACYCEGSEILLIRKYLFYVKMY